MDGCDEKVGILELKSLFLWMIQVNPLYLMVRGKIFLVGTKSKTRDASGPHQHREYNAVIFTVAGCYRRAYGIAEAMP